MPLRKEKLRAVLPPFPRPTAPVARLQTGLDQPVSLLERMEARECGGHRCAFSTPA
jgi:hypothetical protein